MKILSLAGLTLSLFVCASARPASAATASDQASLQFTVPAPDPVQAGETIALQALAVNMGATAWPAGSYYWVAEIYDVEYRFLTRTEQISPNDVVAPGGIASISLPFPVPTIATGRRFYRVYLIKDNQRLIESDYKAFQIVEKPIPPPPESVDYRVSGNVTVSMKNSSIGRWRQVNGSTAINLVGKIKESSYLLNANLIHAPGKTVDPFSILFSYYAPWGRIYAGDISPTYSQLSLNGLGLRGVMLEQQKGRFDWSALGGQSITSQAGTAAINGRYARSVFAVRAGIALPAKFKLGFNVFQSADEPGSLSSDPKSNNFRGPSLTAQKNSGMGLNLTWQPKTGINVTADYQKNDFTTSVAPKVSDTARRIEFRWDAKYVKFKVWTLKAGPRFVSFGAPSIIGDRNTDDVTIGLFPVTWYTLNLNVNQYTDNLANDRNKLTTTQRILNIGNVFHLPTGTDISLSASQNTAKGKPTTALNNKTVTQSVGLSQAVKKHSFSLNVQTSQFTDANKLAHDLNTQTIAVSANLALPRGSIGSLGGTTSTAKDKFDGSKRASQSISASYSRQMWTSWTGLFFGSQTTTKNTSPLFPSDTSILSVNSELAWAVEKHSNVAFGLGYNSKKDKIVASNTSKEIILSVRYSYSF